MSKHTDEKTTNRPSRSKQPQASATEGVAPLPFAPEGWTRRPESISKWADRIGLDRRTLRKHIAKRTFIAHQVTPRKWSFAIHTLPPLLREKHLRLQGAIHQE